MLTASPNNTSIDDILHLPIKLSPNSLAVRRAMFPHNNNLSTSQHRSSPINLKKLLPLNSGVAKLDQLDTIAAEGREEARRVFKAEREQLSRDQLELNNNRLALLAEKNAWARETQEKSRVINNIAQLQDTYDSIVIKCKNKILSEKDKNAQLNKEIQQLKLEQKSLNQEWQDNVHTLRRELKLNFKTKLQLQETELQQEYCAKSKEKSNEIEILQQQLERIRKEMKEKEEKEKETARRCNKSDREKDADLSALGQLIQEIEAREQQFEAKKEHFEMAAQEREKLLERREVEYEERLNDLMQREEALTLAQNCVVEREEVITLQEVEYSIHFNNHSLMQQRLQAWEIELLSLEKSLMLKANQLSNKENHLNEFLNPFQDSTSNFRSPAATFNQSSTTHLVAQ
jgi:hypothetical protein